MLLSGSPLLPAETWEQGWEESHVALGEPCSVSGAWLLQTTLAFHEIVPLASH